MKSALFTIFALVALLTTAPVSYTHLAGNNTNGSRNMNATLGLNWQVDSMTFVNIYGNFNLTRNNSANNNRQGTFNENPHLDILCLLYTSKVQTRNYKS